MDSALAPLPLGSGDQERAEGLEQCGAGFRQVHDRHISSDDMLRIGLVIGQAIASLVDHRPHQKRS